MDIYVLWLEVLGFVIISAICSGLNIALLSLSPADLKRKANLGDAQAARVLPLRLNSHLTLAAILLTNVAAVAATSLFIDSQYSGLVAGIASTLLIVIFGEIFPQALFSRSALRLCSTFSPLLKIMIVITYPVSKPLQILLDRLFGHPKDKLHSRHELGMIIGEHIGDKSSEIDGDEAAIMRGALSLSEKKVRDIMTDMSHTYWMTPDTLIDARKLDEIKIESWSRIPIFDIKKTTCYGVILMKDLVDVDFDENPKRVNEIFIHPTKTVGSKTALDTMFRKFIGAQSHLIAVEREGLIIGVVTIEDLIEEILGHEIEDESDHSRATASI